MSDETEIDIAYNKAYDYDSHDALPPDVVMDDEAQEGAASAIDEASSQMIAAGVPLYQLFLPYSRESFVAAFTDELAVGDFVVVNTRYGKDVAQVKRRLDLKAQQNGAKAVMAERRVTDGDIARMKRNKKLEADAFAICKAKIEHYGLNMKLVCAHYLLEESKVLFFFTSDNRVDFRELVKALVSSFRMRIELRQIGIRDETRMLGGLGLCGREFCCHSFCERLRPVSIRMAKEQSLSLNSMKISGHCGRLLCCLGYECNFYSEARKLMPNEGCKLKEGDTIWRVTESNAVLGRVTLSTEDGSTQKLDKSRF